MSAQTPDPKIYHITHVANLAAIVAEGAHSRRKEAGGVTFLLMLANGRKAGEIRPDRPLPQDRRGRQPIVSRKKEEAAPKILT